MKIRKKIMKILSVAFCLPIYALLGGIPTEDGVPTDDNKGQENGEENKQKSNTKDSEKNQKTFTQDEVTQMMAKEKRQGRAQILKELGFENSEDAKKAITNYNEYLKTQKSDTELMQEQLENEKKARSEAESKFLTVQNKMTALNQGVKTEYVEDILQLASSKVTQEKSFDDVITEMKADTKYSSFFKVENQGTGNNPGNKSKVVNAEGLGARLAASRSNKNTKSSYFGK